MKLINIILQIPLWLLVFASFAGGIYAAIYKIQGITFATPAILLVIIVMYIVGRILSRNKKPRFTA